MVERCLVCLGPLDQDVVDDSHGRCLRRLLGTTRPVQVDIDPARLVSLAAQMAGNLTLPGAQPKVAVELDRSTLRGALGPSRFLLKPQLAERPQLPENEHLTSHLAAFLGVDTPIAGLVRLADGSRALLVQRFDRVDGSRRLPVEDFCQLAQKPPSEKRDGSAELGAQLIREFSSAPPFDQLKHWRLHLVSWWLGNDNLHLKNMALLSRAPGEPRLAPAYDLANTRVFAPDAPLALSVDGKREDLDAEAWFRFAAHAAIPAPLVRKEAATLLSRMQQAKRLVPDSFLPPELQATYLELVADRTSVVVDLARQP